MAEPANKAMRLRPMARALRGTLDARPGVLVFARDPITPWEGRELVTVAGDVPMVQAIAARGVDVRALPVVLNLNGRYYARREWGSLVLRRGDVATLVWLPAGGGSNPLRVIIGIVLIIVGAVMSYYAPGSGTPLISMGVSMLINEALAKKPIKPSTDAANALANPSPTYNLQAQGNYARLSQPIPVIYGRCRVFMDFGAMPYGEFADNEQVLYQLFALGQGSYDIEAVQIEDQPLDGTLGADGIWRSDSPFKDISWQIVPPGGLVTLFPARVISSLAVGGQELLTNASVGPFQLVADEVDTIGVDVVCPKGLYYANDNGGLDWRAVVFQVWAQKLKQSGAAWVADGAEVLLGTENITATTATAQRRSYRYKVDTARYQVRLVRTNLKDTDSRAANDVNWIGLRGYVPGVQAYGDVTMIAMRMRASDQLSGQASRKVNVIATRKLRTWSPDTGWSVTEVPTRSIAWAFADACRNDQYGAGLSDDALPLQQLWAYEGNAWRSDLPAGDAFDYVFDRAMPVSEALTHIARAGRSSWYMQGPSLRVVRDERRTVPVALYNMRNIVRGSFKLNYRMSDDDATDSVEVTYFDDQIWKQDTFACTPPGFSNDNPAKIDLAGVQRRDQAARLGHHMARNTRWRNATGSFQLDREGVLARPGDMVAVSHDVAEWGVSCELLGFSGTGKNGGDLLVLSEPVTFGTGDHYIGLATRAGGFSGPWRVTAGPEADQVLLAENITDAAYTPYVGRGADRTRVSFGAGDAFAARVVIVPPIRMRSGKVELNFVVDDDRAYDETGVSTPAVDTPYTLPTPNKPRVLGLYVVFSGTSSAPALDLTWFSEGNPSFYLVETSEDGTHFTRAGEPSSASFKLSCQLKPLWIRVAAVAALRGDWVEWSGNPATMMARPADVTGLKVAQPVAGHPTWFASTDPEFVWNDSARADGYRIEIWSGGVKRAEHDRREARFVYSLAANLADGGPRRAFDLHVVAYNGAGESTPAVLSVSNPQHAIASLAGYDAGAAFTIVGSTPVEDDFAGMRVVMSQINGFDPAAATPHDVRGTLYNSGKIAPGTWYVRAAYYDRFGADSLNWSTQLTIIVSSPAAGVQTVADASAITGDANTDPPGGSSFEVVFSTVHQSIWAWNKPAGHYFNTADLGNGYFNLVAATQAAFAKLSAISAYLGNVTIDANGWLRSNGVTGYAGGTSGVFLGYDGGTHKARFGGYQGSGTGGIGWDGSAAKLWGPDGTAVITAGATLSLSYLIANSAVTIDASGKLQGIGAGAGTSVSNNQIYVSGGSLYGIGSGAGTQVDNAAVPLGGNMLPNSDLAGALAPWILGWNQDGWPSVTFGRDLAGADWTPSGGHQVGVVRAGAATGIQDFYCDVTIPVVGGARYEVSAYVANHRGRCRVGVVFYKLVSGNWTYVSEGWTSASVLSGNGGPSLSGWERLYNFFSAPADATFCRFTVRQESTGESDPYCWVTRAFFGRAAPNQTQPSEWSPAGVTDTRQLGYVGDLNATYGAHAGTNLFDSVGNALNDALVRNDQQPWSWITGLGKPADNANRTYIDGSGTIQGVASGAGTPVHNDLLVPSINSAATTATWSGVSGLGKPADNATDGAQIGINLTGAWAQATWDAVMPGALIRSAHIMGLTVDKLLAGYLAVGQNIASTSYYPGYSGWIIRADGTAEFRNVIVRGDVEATSIKAGTVNAIDRLMVKGDAVFVPRFAEITSPFACAGTGNFNVLSVTADTSNLSMVIFFFKGYGNSSGGGWIEVVRDDGFLVHRELTSALLSYPNHTVQVDPSPLQRTTTYYWRWQGKTASGTMNVTGAQLLMMGAR